VSNYNRRTDRLTGHDYPGVRNAGFIQFEIDELELGARVAFAIDSPEQAWWETIGRVQLEQLEKEVRPYVSEST
jgi:hypothetical protein